MIPVAMLAAAAPPPFVVRPAEPGMPQLVCSYCRRTYREGPAENVSHGCCPPCHAQVMADIAANKARRLALEASR